MKLPQIITMPHPLLRQTLQQVATFDSELEQLSKTMILAMKQADGVGLAANQININAQIFVYGVEQSFEYRGKKQPAIPVRAIVNPKISIIDDTMEIMEEGCLSIPNIWGPVARPYGIHLDAQDIHGNQISEDLYGYEARIVQHETDHLNGRLFLDYITDPSKLHRGKE